VNGLIRRGLNPESITRYVTKPILLCGFIAITPEIQVVMSAGCDGLAAVMGYSPSATLESYYAEMKVFDLKGAASALRPDSAVLVESTILDKMGSALTALRDLSRWSVQAAISVPTALFFELLSYATVMSIFGRRTVAAHISHGGLRALAGFYRRLLTLTCSSEALSIRDANGRPASLARSVELDRCDNTGVAHLLRSYVDTLFATAAIDPAGEFGMVELIAVTPTVVVCALALTMSS